MMMPTEHLETALRHLRRIVATAAQADAPITPREALEQIEEELDLAGFGLALQPERSRRSGR
jgi:hypothetical protein